MVGKVGVLLLLFAMRSTLGVRFSDFFPYGDGLTENNQRLGNGDSSHGCIFLHERFHFSGKTFLDLCVSNCTQNSYIVTSVHLILYHKSDV